MGFHPETGEELLPVDRDTVQRWKGQQEERVRQEARRAPQRVDPDKYSPFDPVTGEARVWYSRNEQRGLEFHDRPGFHQSTGERLEIITREIIDTWRKQVSENASQKCYVITRDAVRYGDRPGIDPSTGRQCRAVTEDLLERLREYEKGNRPKRIDAATPLFFDLRTGEPIVWYRTNNDGVVELFDLMGFHAETGDELLPVTREITDLWRKQTEEKQRRIPQRIDIGQYAPFDPLTGAPRVWFWRSDKGDYEFYDGAGFHPHIGEPLGLLTREIIAKREEELLQRKREEQKKAEADQRRIPQRVDPDQYAPFDPLTGTPRVWYWRSDKGDYEFYDSAGFHPRTSEPLGLLTREIIAKREEELLQRKREEQKKAEADQRRIPQRVDLEQYAPFDPLTGTPRVWYWRSDKGDYEFYDGAGFHPRTSEPLGLLTREIIAKREEELLQRKREEQKKAEADQRRIPQRVDPDQYAPFDPLTGTPRVWYWRRDKGTYEFFDSAGFHQSTGERLEIVTREIIDTWRKHSESASQKCYVITRDAVRYGDRPGIDPSTGRQCRTVTEDLLERLREYEKGNRPKRIDATSPLFFDLRSGEPIVWYRTNNDGVVELFDLMGFHAETGDELLPVTREIADLWRKQTEEKQRRIPQLIDIGQYAPFDPLTGAPRVWYWRSDKGDYEFYDGAGFHPHTGEPLGLLTREIIAKREEEILQRKREEQKQAEADQRRSPQRVDLDQYAPFDPLTGAPRVWYWRSDKGAYEFFDSAGFHPSTGEPLSALTRETIKKREAEAHEKAESERLEKQQRAEQEEQERSKREAEQKKRAEQEDRERRKREDEQKKRAEQEDQERRKREAEREREAQAAKLCDQLAGNPNDPRRAAEGVSYEVLRSHAKEAAEHCELAVKRLPSELRFQYQLARALQFVDRQKAFEAQKRLVELKYPAAFDNAGWLSISQDRNHAQAAKLFRMGAQLGDPDSMMSLADLIEKGYTSPLNASETPLSLYARAARLGHPRALEKLQIEQDHASRAEQDRRRQEDGARQMMQLIGPMLRIR